MSRIHFLTHLLQHPSPANLAELVLLGAVFLALCYLTSKVELTVIVVAGLFLELFAGDWNLMGIPLPLDRLCLAFALVVLVLRGARAVSDRRIVLRPLHVVLILAAAWATASAIVAGTIDTSLGFYALLDRFGVVPFAFFFLAPVLFGSHKQRNLLLVLLVAMGLYLSVTGVFEGLHVYRLVFPRYIANPNVGIQFGRARGPFLDTTGEGFCIIAGAAGASVALRTWRSWWSRLLCYATIGLAIPAALFTQTRAVWISAVLGAVVTLWMVKRTRRWVPRLLVAGALAIVLALGVSAALRTQTVNSINRQASVWDRQNTDLAALRIVEERPLTGVGWENFINVSWEYMRQQPGYPITGLGIEVHNVFLSHAAELGVPGFSLWTLGFLGALRRAFMRPRRRRNGGGRAQDEAPLPAWWEQWRPAGVAVVLSFLVLADLAPFAEPLANTLLWTWLGILAIPYTSALRHPVREVQPVLAALESRGAPQLQPAGT